MARPTPAAEVNVDAGLVRRLLAAQHPDLAALALRRVGTGWDNEVFRLGAALTVRIPRRELGADFIAKELRWLPELAPRLPLPVPAPVREGRPGAGYPWPWAICRWVPGRPLGAARLTGSRGERAAVDLAAFLRALHVPAPPGGPANPYRGVPLAQRSDILGEVLPLLGDRWGAAIARSWDRACEVPLHAGPPMWLHGDLHGLNVLADRGRIRGVIDFGDLCIGDPATDLACAWLLLDRRSRDLFRRELDPPDATWERARGWALLLAVMFLAHSAGSPVNRAIGESGLVEVLGRDGTS